MPHKQNQIIREFPLLGRVDFMGPGLGSQEKKMFDNTNKKNEFENHTNN